MACLLPIKFEKRSIVYTVDDDDQVARSAVDATYEVPTGASQPSSRFGRKDLVLFCFPARYQDLGFLFRAGNLAQPDMGFKIITREVISLPAAHVRDTCERDVGSII